ncbi:MAG: flippase-like domain-containing protein [Deltaproteobacteria bacterium]|nr:flippase-like domain-containing protein [Deltaproteobacteria bacterium]
MQKLLQNKKLLILLASFLVLGIFSFIFFSKFDWETFWNSFQGIKIEYFLLACAATVGIILVKAYQIRIYLPKDKKVSVKKLFEDVSMLLMSVNLIPLWGGHALFVYLLGSHKKVGKTLAFSVITMDQVLDGFGKLAVFLAVSLMVPLPPMLKDGLFALILLVTIPYLIMLFVAYKYRNLKMEDLKPVSGFKQKVGRAFTKWAFNLHAIRDFRKVYPIIFIAVLMRGFEALAVFWVQKGFGLELPYYASIFVVAAFSFATTIPSVTPARTGVFEGAVISAYHFLGIPTEKAMALALIVHVVHTLPFVVTGYLVSLKLGFNRKKFQLAQEAEVALTLPIPEEL